MSSESAREAHVAQLMGPSTPWGEKEEAVIEADRVDSAVVPDWRKSTAELERERENEIEVAQDRDAGADTEQQIDTLEKGNLQAAYQLGQLETIAAAQQQAQQYVPPPPPPPVEHDPVGHIVHRMQQQDGAIRAIGQILGQQHQASQQQQQAAVVSAVQTHAQQSENNFRAQQPDYDDAARFLIDHRDNELKTTGHADANQRRAILQREAWEVAARAAEAGKSPAELVYELARQRGFGGGTPSSARDVLALSTQEFNRRFPNQRGNPNAPTGQKLVQMSDADFEKALDKVDLRQVMGY